MSNKKSCVVVGDGLIGLTTALRARAKGFDVSIYTDSLPDGTMHKQAASPKGAGQWFPFHLGGDVAKSDRWCQDTYDVFAEHVEDPDSGIVEAENYELFTSEDEFNHVPAPIANQAEFETYQGDEIPGYVPSDVIGVWEFKTYLVTMAKYLPYLRQACRDAGITFVHGQRKSIDQLAVDYKADVYFNCAGLWGGEISEGETPKAVKGQGVLFPPSGREIMIGYGDYAIYSRTDHAATGALWVEEFESLAARKVDSNKILTVVRDWEIGRAHV